MTFTLKNRPRLQEITFKDKRLSGKPVTGAKIPYPETYEEWFEGFEAQERERMQFAEARLKTFDQREGKQEAEAMWEVGYIQAKKEILGE